MNRRDIFESLAMFIALSHRFDDGLCVWLVDLSKRDGAS